MSVERYFLSDCEKYACLVNGEGKDFIAIPLETQHHGTIFLEENYMPYMYVPFICVLLIQIDE